MSLSAVLISGFNELLEYLSAHVLTCLVPAFFIAGAIAVFVSTGAVLKYFGPQTKKYISYGVASVSGIVLAVCSCTILPLFGGIYRKGAGLGPAITFLYSGPAINLLAIVLTARKLGWNLGAGRAVGAILFSIVIGLIMAMLFRREELEKSQKSAAAFEMAGSEEGTKTTEQLLAYFGVLVAILVFGTAGISVTAKVAILLALLVILAVMLVRWFDREEISAWMSETWNLVRLIVPVLLVGVFVAGMLKVIIPHEWIGMSVGDNSLRSNLIASAAGALMYFSTLTEVPRGMAKSGISNPSSGLKSFSSSSITTLLCFLYTI